jgi:hypothetical protein
MRKEGNSKLDNACAHGDDQVDQYIMVGGLGELGV